MNEAVRQVIETIDVSINPTKDEQRAKKKKSRLKTMKTHLDHLIIEDFDIHLLQNQLVLQFLFFDNL